MKHYFPVVLATLTIAFAGEAMALEVDMSKMTCKEAADLSKAKTAAVAIWIAGIAAGKTNNMMLDTDKMIANADKIKDYCNKNPTSTLVDAVSKM